jgi:hypothetical protein
LSDLPVKPMRKTIRQTAIILNVSRRTVYRYLEEGKLLWSGNQVLLSSIIKLLETESHEEEETDEEVEEKLQKAPRRARRTSGWVRNY